MPIPSQTAVRNVADWSASNMWEMEFLQFPNAVPGFSTDDLYLLCQSSGLPKRTISQVAVELHGHQHRRAGRGTVAGTLNMMFLGTVDHKVLDFMKKWRDVIYSPDEGIQVPYTDYIALIQLRLLDRKQVPYYFYNMKGVYLADPDHGAGGLTSGDRQPFIHSLGLIYDDFDDGAYTG